MLGTVPLSNYIIFLFNTFFYIGLISLATGFMTFFTIISPN